MCLPQGSGREKFTRTWIVIKCDWSNCTSWLVIEPRQVIVINVSIIYWQDNPHRLMLTMSPDKEYLSKQEAEEKERLAKKVAALSDEDKRVILLRSKTTIWLLRYILQKILVIYVHEMDVLFVLQLVHGLGWDSLVCRWVSECMCVCACVCMCAHVRARKTEGKRDWALLRGWYKNKKQNKKNKQKTASVLWSW